LEAIKPDAQHCTFGFELNIHLIEHTQSSWKFFSVGGSSIV